jgi:hypothetical protein
LKTETYKLSQSISKQDEHIIRNSSLNAETSLLECLATVFERSSPEYEKMRDFFKTKYLYDTTQPIKLIYSEVKSDTDLPSHLLALEEKHKRLILTYLPETLENDKIWKEAVMLD